MGIAIVAGGLAFVSVCSAASFSLAHIARKLRSARLIGIQEGSAAVLAGLRPFYEGNATTIAALLAADASFEQELDGSDNTERKIDRWLIHARRLGHAVGHTLTFR